MPARNGGLFPAFAKLAQIISFATIDDALRVIIRDGAQSHAPLTDFEHKHPICLNTFAGSGPRLAK